MLNDMMYYISNSFKSFEGNERNNKPCGDDPRGDTLLFKINET
jgi:hypothetical protein